MIYGYIRVSTDYQTVENQRFEINAFCKAEDMRIDGWDGRDHQWDNVQTTRGNWANCLGESGRGALGET